MDFQFDSLKTTQMVYVERHEEQNLIDSLLANPADAEVKEKR